MKKLLKRFLRSLPGFPRFAEGGELPERHTETGEDPVRLIPRYHYGGRVFDTEEELAAAMIEDGLNPYVDLSYLENARRRWENSRKQ